jgi:crotonobetainyl-CoA:carnitine CoA-transferase CaiB-like acyl-CoA transferase
MDTHGQAMPLVGTPMRFDGQRPGSPLPPPMLDQHGQALRQALACDPSWPAAEAERQRR